MQLTARMAPNNPPGDISDLDRVTRLLKDRISAHGGTDDAQGPTFDPRIRSLPYNHGHCGLVQLPSTAQGDYDPDYVMRRFVAAGQGGSVLSLGPREAFIFRFLGRAVVVRGEFWSLTAYDAEQYLVANSLNQYALGDRPDMMYADGLLVYDDKSSGDKGFEILCRRSGELAPRVDGGDSSGTRKGERSLGLGLIGRELISQRISVLCPERGTADRAVGTSVVQKVEAVA
ncbi:DUF1254-domain-containing protein [Penicillium canariense]|uniref:DUF1254-domain-containing protein n=1 Tax=Penicillium canariense TaxID=189055 RepID=A0A9W9I314_9EURO|nr:DUF1254-domain-containing protein [Penicillium canariense]KAJ5166995.1 DUF1254-domain-containing protein [Penicillium canariense]